MALSRPKLIIAVIAAVVVVGGATVVALQKPKGDGQTAAAGAPGAKPAGGPGGAGGARGGPTNVIAVPALERVFSSRIEAIGTLEPHEQVILTANAADRVTSLSFEDGQRVKKGTTLLTLVSDEEKAALVSAQATLDNAKLVYERNQRLAKDNAIAELDLEKSKTTAEAAQANVEGAQARLRDRVLIAPFDGVLGFRQISVGAFVAPGQPVATLIDDSQMRLEFGVPAGFLNDLHKGLPIEATTPSFNNRTFNGELTTIDNAIDPVSRTVKIRATLPNKDGMLKAGMFMSVRLMSKERTSLAIPEISVISEGSKTFVYVVAQSTGGPGGPGGGRGDGGGAPGGKRPSADAGAPSAIGAPGGKAPDGAGGKGQGGGGRGGQQAKKVEVVLGARERGTVEIISGLKKGDLVVTDGVLKLRPNAPVRAQVKPPEEVVQPVTPDDGANGPLAAGEGPSDKAGLRQ